MWGAVCALALLSLSDGSMIRLNSSNVSYYIVSVPFQFSTIEPSTAFPVSKISPNFACEPISDKYDGTIVVAQWGNCDPRKKMEHVKEAGAVGLFIFDFGSSEQHNSYPFYTLMQVRRQP